VFQLPRQVSLSQFCWHSVSNGQLRQTVNASDPQLVVLVLDLRGIQQHVGLQYFAARPIRSAAKNAPA